MYTPYYGLYPLCNSALQGGGGGGTIIIRLIMPGLAASWKINVIERENKHRFGTVLIFYCANPQHTHPNVQYSLCL